MVKMNKLMGVNYNFEVETLEAGQRRSYGDSYYIYKVTSDLGEQCVRAFCMHVLQISYTKDKMPDPFAGQLLEFKKITDNNKDKGFFEKQESETYSYKVKREYTG